MQYFIECYDKRGKELYILYDYSKYLDRNYPSWSSAWIYSLLKNDKQIRRFNSLKETRYILHIIKNVSYIKNQNYLLTIINK